MEVDSVNYIALLEVPDKKIEILPGASSDLTSVTFCVREEDHTLGNSLRWAVMQNPQVDFCGYSIPHPSEAKMNIRIQTVDQVTAVDALDKGIDDLKSISQFIKAKFQQRVQEGNYAKIDC